MTQNDINSILRQLNAIQVNGKRIFRATQEPIVNGVNLRIDNGRTVGNMEFPLDREDRELLLEEKRQ